MFLQCPCIDGENGDGVQGYGTEEPEERASSSYPDLLIESINVLKTAQEALENGWPCFLSSLLRIFYDFSSIFSS